MKLKIVVGLISLAIATHASAAPSCPFDPSAMFPPTSCVTQIKLQSDQPMPYVDLKPNCLLVIEYSFPKAMNAMACVGGTVGVGVIGWPYKNSLRGCTLPVLLSTNGQPGTLMDRQGKIKVYNNTKQVIKAVYCQFG